MNNKFHDIDFIFNFYTSFQLMNILNPKHLNYINNRINSCVYPNYLRYKGMNNII